MIVPFLVGTAIVLALAATAAWTGAAFCREVRVRRLQGRHFSR
ncbi:hypothetical protein ABZX40_37400 [Streptomyces sp. NPDC004610]